VAKVIGLANLADELSKALKVEKQFIEDNADVALRAAAIKTFSKIIKMTPVGNPELWVYNHPERGYIDYIGYFGNPDYVGGRARSNWFVGGSVTDKTTDATNKSMGASSIASGLPDDLWNNKAFLYNNLPYIEALEYGHSTQAPAGFVRVSLLNWDRTLKKAFKGLKWHT